MSAGAIERFTCDQCKRVFAWKEHLAGKRVKCKCGHAIAVPAARAAVEEPADDDLYALAAEAEAAAAAQPVVIREMPAAAAKSAGPARGAAAAVPLAYQRGPTARERERSSIDATLDIVRDVYVPLTMLAVGILLSVGYYALHYRLGGIGIAVIGFGVVFITLLKAVGLILFALVIAGPLGVSFGGIWSTALKLAATVVLSDGITTIVDMLIGKIGGGFATGGPMGVGIIAWPISIFTYYCSFVYLFSMDAGDAWMVVVILSIVDYIARWVLGILLLGAVMSMGHVALPASSASGFGSSVRHSASPDPLADKMDRLKGTSWLIEGHDYVKHEVYMTDVVNNLYAHGCAHVWFEVTRDINQHASSAGDVIAELPDNPTQRAACYSDVTAFYKTNPQISYDPADLVDKGNPYLEIDMQ